MFESLETLVEDGRVPGVTDFETAQWNVVKGIAKGLLKTISKMGISTIQSYNGAQIFEAVGLAPELIDRYFVGTASRIGGIDAQILAVETLERHARGFALTNDDLLPVGGVYAWRREGEHHMWNPETIALIQHAVRHGGQPTYDEYAKLVNEDAGRRATLRGLLKFRELPESEWLSLDDVEPASEIVKRFVTGAMSLGSLSREAHETLAIAMNRIGGKSNTGEGGEDLKQLIYDLRCANPRARISVKLVSEVGVGTVAAGVAKANADHVLIAGHDGGTGASPLSSIQAAGVPWEIGLAET